MQDDPTEPSKRTARTSGSSLSRFSYSGVGIPASREGVKFAYVAMIPIVVLTILWYVDIQYRGQIIAGRIEAHRTDFTVFTEAGAALFDGRNLYRVTNPRGWYYLYPPLFALLVSPLSFLDSRSQVFIWYLISIASGFGCYDEACRIWCAVTFPQARAESRRRRKSNLAIGIGVCAGLTIALPALDCLQRGQLGIVLVYSLLLGFRLAMSPGSWFKAGLGGLVLAWPVVVKLIPALPVLCILLHRWSVVLARGGRRQPVSRAAGLSTGLALGGFLFLFAIPGAAIGWEKNLQYLHEWRSRVATNEKIGQDAKFNIDGTGNQSLTNAVHLFADTWRGVARTSSTDLHRLALDGEIARRHQADRITRLVAVAAQLLVLVLLGAVLFKLSRDTGPLAEATMFGLSCLAVLMISPLAWSHYYVFALPAVLFVPLWLERQSRPLAACLAAAGLPMLTWMHYVLKPWFGPVGLLGLGTALWFVAVCAIVLFRTGPSTGRLQVPQVSYSIPRVPGTPLSILGGHGDLGVGETPLLTAVQADHDRSLEAAPECC